MITIIADDRETNGANPFFDKFIVANNAKYSKQPIKNGGGDIKLCINRVTTGDYNIVINSGKKDSKGRDIPIVAMVIERKTWKDLAASLKDGRAETQNKEMLSVQERTGCILTYLIEGKICYDKDYKVGRIPFANLDAKRRHLSLRGHSVLQTKDQEHTAEMIVNLARDVWRLFNSGELKFEPGIRGGSKSTSEEPPKKLAREINYRSYTEELRELNAKYAVLGNKLVTLASRTSNEAEKDLIPLTTNKPISGEIEIIDDIDEIEAAVEKSEEGSENLEDVELAANLALLNIHSDETTIPAILTERKIRPDADIIERMWIAIPGVSVKSAPVLIEKYRLGDLISANDSLAAKLTKQIAELQYPTGRRFGDDLASKIMKLSYAGKAVTRLNDLKNISIGILAEIPGVTRESAKAILEKYSLREICSGNVNEDDLAEIQKSGNRKLGLKTAQKIMELLI